MVGEGDGAVLALADVSAGWALERTGEASAVEEEDDLLAILELGFHGDAEFVGEDGIAAFLLLGFELHVHDADDGHGLVIDSLGEVDELVFTGLGVMK